MCTCIGEHEVAYSVMYLCSFLSLYIVLHVCVREREYSVICIYMHASIWVYSLWCVVRSWSSNSYIHLSG